MTPISHRRRHAPFYIAALIGAAAVPVALLVLPQLTIEVVANTFFLVYLALCARKIRSLSAAVLKKHAAVADDPVWAIFAVTFGAVVTAVVSLFLVINGRDKHDTLTLVLSLASVALGWLTIHTMASLHYAHRYWQRPGPGPVREEGGLQFPGTDEPEGYDFLYFGFVIGMTAQTSDVAITSNRMRRINLLHALVSFLFNTVLVAAAVNVALSLN